MGTVTLEKSLISVAIAPKESGFADSLSLINWEWSGLNPSLSFWVSPL
jgi:hypothetical protein